MTSIQKPHCRSKSCFLLQAFNFSFLLSTSQTPVKTTNKWTLETSTNLGGFGCVCDEGYGVSYIIVGEDTGECGPVRFSHFGPSEVVKCRSKRQSCSQAFLSHFSLLLLLYTILVTPLGTLQAKRERANLATDEPHSLCKTTLSKRLLFRSICLVTTCLFLLLHAQMFQVSGGKKEREKEKSLAVSFSPASNMRY